MLRNELQLPRLGIDVTEDFRELFGNRIVVPAIGQFPVRVRVLPFAILHGLAGCRVIAFDFKRTDVDFSFVPVFAHVSRLM